MPSPGTSPPCHLVESRRAPSVPASTSTSRRARRSRGDRNRAPRRSRAHGEQGEARSGESRTRSSTSTRDISSGRRGGKRSGKSGPRGRTRDQLYNDAKKLGIEGRSRMNKAQLQRAVAGKSCGHLRERGAGCRLSRGDWLAGPTRALAHVPAEFQRRDRPPGVSSWPPPRPMPNPDPSAGRRCAPELAGLRPVKGLEIVPDFGQLSPTTNGG